MILVVVLLFLLNAGPYRYAIGQNRFWLCVFSLWFDSQCCVGVVSGSVVVTCFFISLSPDLWRETSVGMPPVWGSDSD